MCPKPELYVQQGEVNAYTAGHTRPYIVLQTGLIDAMGDDEIMAIIAHELGHIKCGHVLYKQIAQGIAPFLEIADKATMGLGALLGMGIEAAMLIWDRRSELSADRAALLAMQENRPCNTMLMKIAGGSARFASELNLDEFLMRARKYRDGTEEEGKIDKFYRFVAGSRASHPHPVERCPALLEWESSADYTRILKGDYNSRPGEAAGTPGPPCSACGRVSPSAARFCASCGNRLSS